MTYKDLLYAVTIYDEGSFSAAAKKLFVSQSALSQAIRKLEEEFGFELFTRSGTRSIPTKAGQVFVTQGRQILQVWDQFESEMHIFADNQQSDLTIGMPPNYMKNLLPHVLPKFEEEHPNVRVEVIEERSDTLEKLAMQDMIDLCVVCEPVHMEGIGRVRLFPSNILVAVPIDHPFCRKHPYRGLDQLETIDLRELKDEPFSLLKNPRVNHIWDKLFAEYDFEPIIYRRSTVWNNVKDYIKYGFSVGMIDEVVVNHEPDDDKIAYYCVNSPAIASRYVVAAYRTGKRISRQEQQFIDALKTYWSSASHQKL